MAEDFSSQFAALTSQISDVRSQLQSSPSAYTQNVAPSARDIALDQDLRRLLSQKQNLANTQLKQQLYGDEQASETAPQDQTGESRLAKFLRVIGAPLSAGAGVAEYVLGKGTQSTLLGDVAANIQERGTYGDILRSFKLPNWIAAPAGLIGDIAFDPLFMATAGTEAIVPKIASGAYKGLVSGEGVVKGLQTAAKAGLLQKAESALRWVPGAARGAEKGVEKGAAGLLKRVGEKSVAAREGYETLMGKTLMDSLQKNSLRAATIQKAVDYLQNKDWGKQVLTLFKYSPNDWYVDALAKAPEGAEKLASSLSKVPTTPLGFEMAKASTIANSSIADFAAKDSLEVAQRMAQLGIEEPAFRKQLANQIQNFEKLSPEEKISVNKEGLRQLYLTGYEFFDKWIEKGIESDRGRQIMGGLAVFSGLFKTAKVPGNLVAALMNSLVGNTTMTAMVGIKAFSPRFLSAIKTGWKISNGKLEELDKMLTGPQGEAIMNFVRSKPDLFSQIYGFDPEIILRREQFFDDFAAPIAAKAMKAGMDGNEVFKTAEELKTLYKNTLKEFDSVAMKKAAAAKGTSAVEAAISGNRPLPSYLTSEYMVGPFAQFVRNVEKMAAEASGPRKYALDAFKWYLKKPGEAYNKADQTFRWAAFKYLVQDGVDSLELKTLAPRFGIKPENLIQVKGQNLWRLDPTKATQMVNEIYMNYLAMPAFVKLMRNLPILGSPFLSFSYGMTANTLKSMPYNPAIFNKIQFLLHEITGGQSPLEKQALDSKYYDYLKQEGMIKLPFFDTPVYLNASNLLPYYTLNIFQPIERNYGAAWGDKFAKFIDDSPFFKTPGGQILMNYLVMPYLLGEAQGSFGQSLYPADASLLRKGGSVLRDAVETLIPPLSAPVGMVLPESVLPYAPFRARQLRYAWQGKTSEGIKSETESRTERVLRTLSSMSGLPVYDVKEYLK